MAFEPIENYGVIGNMQSIALVGMNGSIDFLCYPNFDSPTVFAALLDDERGGRFEIRPQLKNVRVRQLYLPDTNILLTRFLAEEGVAELTDYMPIETDGEQPNEIVRRVSVIRGTVHFTMRCQPRFKYAASTYELQISDRCARFFPAHNSFPPMSLYSTVAIEGRSDDVISEFGLQAGETATFVFGPVRAQGEPPEMDLLAQRFLDTAQFWKTWISKSQLQRPLAGNGPPLRFSFEDAHQPTTRFTDCGTDVFSTGEYWGSAQLGLSLHLVAGCSIHAVCADSPGFCG